VNKPEQIKACVFDAYGTLFDVHSAVGKHRARLGDKADQVSQLWRQKQLEYSWLRSLMHAYISFWRITQDALDYALADAGIHDDALRDDLANAYLQLTAYAEVSSTLTKLRDGGRKTAILSNGSSDMLQAAVNNANLADQFEAVLSVDEVGIFKPDPRVYQLACNRLSLKPEEIVFLSSNNWDAAGAATFGFRVVWINRFKQRWDYLPGAAEAEITALDQLPGLLKG
jgi:2-haloacid dehalogenase